MHGEIITIGNELISGRTLDLNGWYAAGRLTASGLRVIRITSVGDDPQKVTDALTRALETSGFVIVTGGLGSTADDITNEIVAQALKRPLCLHEGMFDRIRTHVEARGIEMTPSLKKMAVMPEGSRVLHPQGSACGFALTEREVRFYFLPGVPDQMRYLMDRCVLPELLSLFDTLPVLRQRVLKLYGLNEPAIAEILKQLEGRTGDVLFGYYPRHPENHITISLRGEDEPAVTRELDRVEEEVRRLVGPYVFATGTMTMEEVIGQTLVEQALTLSVAESCTGGMIGHLITNAPGSSHYFQGGVVVYSNASKACLLKVRPETLERHGAVSDATVREMAVGVKEALKTDLGLAVTGIAGPDGGSEQKPVGTVFLGLSKGEDVFSRKYRFWGNREQIKANSSMMALDWVRRFLNGDPFLPGL